ncbi:MULTISPECIES: ATP-dependent Clp protease adapter ClpS [Brevibacterium]|uniref:ATP-dependent Clp protease adapter ClpS n=1 Tax=Brevibacterium TaxID=1696 RepID=UPI000DEBD97C|nr:MULTISPECIES: ATP-dependent Clp protease adapter ClpS [Brevibacterium]
MSNPTTPVLEPEVAQRPAEDLARPWKTVVFNDPVNLMSYVSYVFQSYFGYSAEKAHKLMLEVHENGRSVVATGSREAMERDTQAMHEFGLWAACQPMTGSD